MFTQWSRAFPGLPEQVAEARHFVAALLHGRSGADDIQLVVGELAANAVKHTLSGKDGGWFLVTLYFGDGLLRIQVEDQGGNGVPTIRAASCQEEGGRGLLLVAACSKGWGTSAGAHGNLVWADFAWSGE
ncbi:ATP-binding protein [Streptomyces katsurahamanus]|uniref:ATP-binding protein n=1 Tax=Streptomyces katsurahamanus TaxID=2577098 RepID=A0ABW9NUT3_9ACTN|nr:ATP-binding protein [Streptomyces katsurahamanus]MQS37055.1 ATP-binding protein [Streptomyces katsurahamanus]